MKMLVILLLVINCSHTLADFASMVKLAIKTFDTEINDNITAINILESANEILVNDSAANDEYLSYTVKELQGLTENVVYKLEANPLTPEGLYNVTAALIRLTETTLKTIQQMTYGHNTNIDSNNTISTYKSKQLVNKTEELVLQLLNVYVNNFDKEIEVEQGSIIAAAVRSVGRNISESVSLYSQTLQIPLAVNNNTDYFDKDVILYVLTHNKNLYSYVENENIINSGTARTFVETVDGKYLELYENQDEIQILVDASDVFDDPKYWKNITSVVTPNEFILNVSVQYRTDSALFNIKLINSQKCKTMAFPQNSSDTIESNALVVIETEGHNTITKGFVNETLDIAVEFSEQIITMKVFPPPNGKTMDPLDFHVTCQVCLGTADVIFALEVTENILEDDFNEARKLMKNLISYIIPGNDVRFAVMTFNWKQKWHHFLNDSSDVNATIDALSYTQLSSTPAPLAVTMPNILTTRNPIDANTTTTITMTTNGYQNFETTINNSQTTVVIPTLSPSYSTNMLSPLNDLKEYIDSNSSIDRQRVIIVLSDGNFNQENVSMALTKLRQDGVQMIAVGVGSFGRSGINLLADNPNAYHAFRVSHSDPDTNDPPENITAKFCKGKWYEDKYFQYRFGKISAHMLNTTSNQWQRSEQVTVKDIFAEKKEVVFKSNFLGTFGTNVFIIPPETIDFEEIILNFDKKLADSPYVLAVIVSLLVLMVIFSILLRTMDNQDARMWAYTPLEDNPIDGKFEYYLSVQTGLWSSSKLSATTCIILQGCNGDSGPRYLIGKDKKNFRRWTTWNFLLTTEFELGPLLKVKIWHDNKGKDTTWFLEKIIIASPSDETRYIFFCDRWLSPQRDDGLYHRTLYPILDNVAEKENLFNMVARFKLFDDYLWLSIIYRPSFSRFSRVQRLYCISAMLFLSMLGSAMWYSSDSNTTIYGINVGPIHINYKQIYVGIMSALISFPAGFILSLIFRNRRFKGEYNNYMIAHENNKAFLPWWCIFTGYALALCFIACGAVFTFFYSLQWGGQKSQSWLVSFVFGTTQGAILMDPVKVIILSLLLVCVFRRYAKTTVLDMAPYSNMPGQNRNYEDGNSAPIEKNPIEHHYPAMEENSTVVSKFRRNLLLDRKMYEALRGILVELFYVTLIAVICSHNMVTSSYWQNTMLLDTISPVHKINTTDDLWNWLERNYTPKVFPKLYYNYNDARLLEGRKYMFDDISYRMGPARLRQKRVKGKCDVTHFMSGLINICPPALFRDTEENIHFCPGWEPYSPVCNDSAYIYRDADNTSALSYYGIFRDYDGGGYTLLLDPDEQEIRNQLYRLRRYNWIDNQTRFVNVEVVLFNINTKLFSLISVYFEKPETGGLSTDINIQTSRLYPYIDTFDFIVLALQILFLLIVFYRLLYIIYDFSKRKRQCLVSLDAWVKLLSVLLSTAAIGCYIARIDRTIAVIEELFNNEGRFVSFEIVQMLDDAYKGCLSFEMFIAIWTVLKPLTFNYYLYLMRTSLVLSRGTLISFIFFLVFPLTGFACLFYFVFCTTSDSFKNMGSSYLTLFRGLLAMVKLRDSFDFESTTNQLAFSVFIFSMSIILVNFFICILNDSFAFVKKQGGRNMAKASSFDHELNRHFWTKIKEVLGIIDIFSSQSKETIEDNDEQKVIENSMKLDNQNLKAEKVLSKAKIPSPFIILMMYRFCHLLNLSDKRDAFYAEAINDIYPEYFESLQLNPK